MIPGIKKKGTTSCPFSPGFTRGSSNIALDLSSLAGTTTQIEQLGAADLALADNGDLLNEGAVDGEDTLNADTVGNAANGKGLCNAAVLLSNDGALESLESAPVEKHSKKGKKIVELKDHIPQVEYTTAGDRVCMELCLPAAQELNLNPSLLTGFLEEKFGLPAASAGILRKRFLTADRQLFA